MNTIAHDYRVRPEIVRADRAVENTVRAFAALGNLALAAAAPVKAAWTRWAEARRQAEADAKLWDLALTDARVMADISRAMSADAIRDIKPYY